MARKIEIDLNADTKGFEQGMDGATKALDKLDAKLDDAHNANSRFESGIDKTTEGLENTTGKLRSTNDLIDGFASVVGLSLPPQAQMILGFADMADGMSGLLGPALKSARAGMASLNATLLANPIVLVIAAIVALVAIFVVAYKKVGWFHDGVNAAFKGITNATKGFVQGVEDAVVGAAKVLGRIADIITTPYQLAFKAIAKLWNATVGGFHIPSIGIGPFKTPGLDIPKMPELAAGGPLGAGQAALVGERGPEIFVPNMGGQVVRNGAIGGGAVTIVWAASADPLWEAIKKNVRVMGGSGPNSVQRALGGTA